MVNLWLLFMNRWLFIIFILLLPFTGCRKEKDETAPKITVYSPSENSFYQLPHTILVKGLVEDDYNIEFITVNITRLNGSNLVAGKSVSIQSRSQAFEVLFDLTAAQIETGEYYLKIKAGDGIQERVKYIPVHLSGIPRELDKLFVVTRPSASMTEIYKVDTAASLFASFSAGFRDFDINSWHRQLVITGETSGDLRVLNIDTEDPVYTVPYVSTAYPYFQFTRYTESNNLVSVKANGTIFVYLQYGNTVSVVNLNEHPLCADELGDKVCAGSVNLFSGQNYFSLYYGISGALYYRTTLDFTPEYISADNSEEVVIFGESAGSGIIKKWNQVSELFSLPVQLPGSIIDVEEGDENIFIIACANDILVYNSATGSLNVLVGAVNSKDIAYDEISGIIYSAEGNEVKLYSIQNGIPVNNITFANPVEGVELLYNK